MILTNGTNSFCSLAFSRFNGFTLIRSGVFLITLAIIVILLPSKATSQCNVSGDIPFLADNNLRGKGCISCSGPWDRMSNLGELDAGVQNCEFYAADVTAFSPYGVWDCDLFTPNPDDLNECDKFGSSVQFCVKDTSSVILTFVPNGSEPPILNVNKPQPNTFGFCPKSLSSFLGDNPKQEKSKPDSDLYLFEGTGVDEVTVRLEANPQEGSNGGDATLAISGNSLNESTSGALPLELDATLPGDGEYSISVEQPKKSAERFRGSYILTVMPATGNIDLIEPSNNVEK